ncbi:MAG: undecaprenyl-diphospho-oligosaccharide flippase [Polyangiaceae bacterium]|nr:undecaprenyl-diphospho-oligosaccharide flippase [Polyangiaceae bacterium]
MTDSNEASAGAQPTVLQRRAKSALWLLTVRAVLLQLMTLGGQVMLARSLEPRDFGVYAILRFALSFFVFFGDVGLGGALIQKKNQPTEDEVGNVFTLQLLLTSGVVVVVWSFAGLVDNVWPDLPTSGPWLLRVLALDLLLTSLRTIPSIMMERTLQFAKLAVLDIVLSFAFYATAVGLALTGHGSQSLVIAVLTQGFVGAVLAYALHPYRPRLRLSREVLRPIIKFGIPFQLTQMIGFLNGAVTPIYAGAALGARALGLINWAQDTAYFPLKAVEIVGRAAFPLYSRLQENPRALGESFGRAVYLCAIATAFFVALVFSMGSNVVHVVFTDKWAAALPILYVYAGVISIGFYTPIIAALLNATGRPQLLFRLSCIWVALAWVGVALATPRWGIDGYAYGYCLHVLVGNILMLSLTPRLVPHARLASRFKGPVLGGIGVYLVGKYALASWAMTPLTFISAVVALLAVHAAVLALVDRRRLFESFSLLPPDTAL